jgi:integrase
MALKDVEIRALKARDRVYKKSDARGLLLEVHPSGSKLWRFRYSYAGRNKRIALGKYPEVSLAEARRKCDEARRSLSDGVDPAAERKRAKLLAVFNSTNTFGDVGKEYIEKMVAEGRADVTTKKAGWLLEQLAPIANSPIADLKPMDVLAALRRIEVKGKYETTRRCRSFAGRIFRYAIATGRAETDPTSALRGALVTPKTTHHAAIVEPPEVGALLRAIDGYTGQAVTRLAMQILPHVMARPGELRQATWDEFDLDAATWTIPAGRMKMRRPHAVPLSCQVVSYLMELQSLSGQTGYAFPAFHTFKRPISENTINQAFRRMGYGVGELTAHGLRTTASTLLNESRRWSPDAIERSLAHADTNAVRSIYNRGRYWDERVAMHQWWSDYLDDLRRA